MQTKYNNGLSIYYPLWISISVLVYWISYVGIINSKIYSERKVIRNTIIKEKTINSSNNNVNIELSDNIASWIKESKIYLNPDLNLNLIAKEFNISKGYLSQLLNSNNNLNFNDYINTLRVEKVKNMIKNQEYDSYKILSLGLEAGFNSKSSFYTAFKKFTNKTPNEYKKEVRNI